MHNREVRFETVPRDRKRQCSLESEQNSEAKEDSSAAKNEPCDPIRRDRREWYEEEQNVIKDKLSKIPSLSFDKPTFGTWMFLFEKLSKSVRERLRVNAEREDEIDNETLRVRRLCQQFGMQDAELLSVLCSTELVKLMNDAMLSFGAAWGPARSAKWRWPAR